MKRVKDMDNRITPEMVLEAYKVTGLKPIRDEWVNKIDGKECGCGLTAIFCAQVDDGFSELSGAGLWADDTIGRALNLDQRYVHGFTAGFDGGAKLDYGEAYEDGRAAWEAVKHLAGTS